jgi:predicted RND superfamily exporter protein
MALTRKRIFRWITEFSYDRHRYLILGTLILGGLSAFLITRLQFQSDVLHLLPANAPTTGAFVKFLKEFGTADSLFIVLERESGGEVESFEPFVDVLVGRLMESGEFGEIQGRMDKEAREEIGQQFVRKALLYLTEDELREVAAKLTDAGIQRQVQVLKTKFHSPLGSFASRFAVQDPLELWPLFQKHVPMGSMRGGMVSEGYLLSEDRKMMLLVAKPKGFASDVRYDEILLEKSQDAVSAAEEEFARKKNIPSAVYFQDLRIGFTGGYITALEDSRMIKRNLGVNFSVSLAGVVCLFVMGFRRRISIFYSLFPLMVSPLFTLGMFSPFLGHLSESTGAFSAIILGLSIDFIILLYSRYLEERNAGQAIPEALETSLSQTGPGVLTGAATTAAAYYALLFSDFRGVKELGLLTGTGILLSLGCAFFLFPALVVWREKGRREERNFGSVTSFGIERVGLLALKYPWPVILLCAVVTLGTIGWAFQVKINNDPRRLRPARQPGLVLEARVQEKMEEGQETVVVLAGSQRADEALEVQGIVQEKIEEGMAAGLSISRYESLAQYIPPLSQQKRNLEWIENRGKEGFNPIRVGKKVKAALQEAGLRVEPFEPGLNLLRDMLANREMLTWETFQGTALKEVGERFLKKSAGGFISAAYLHVEPGFWSDPKAKGFLEKLKRRVPDIQVTGSKPVQGELEKLMSGEAWKLLLIALIAVCALIYFDFRSWPLTLLSLLPVALGLFWTLGLMGILGMDLNFMNLVIFTMVVGVGVDYGVHILHRQLENGLARFEPGLVQVSKGVVLSALTTLVSFGSLVLSGYPGLRSMGTAALMGVSFSALIALTLLPVLLRKRLPKDSPF